MLIYGDHARRADPQAEIDSIDARLQQVERLGPGIERHSELVAALVCAGQLQQGIADHLFEQHKRDRQSDPVDQVGGFLHELGKAVCRSWGSDFAEVDAIPKLQVRELPEDILLRLPEGFGFYAVYPEAYIDAARALQLDAPPRVIGIRSIGTALAAVVAAALGTEPPVTVRPFGQSADRKIAVDATLEERLLSGEAHYIIVDEGPGQSGSSFAGVAEWLSARGIANDRIAVLPSHGAPPGPAATDERRKWWRSAQRSVGHFGERWAEIVHHWVEAAVGPLDGPLREISGGEWRRLAFNDERRWPPVVGAWERRKFLGSRSGELILVKFAGLGAIGEEKFRLAETLHIEGFVPEPLALAHGMLVERWLSAAVPLDDEKPVSEIGRYIAVRSRLLPAAKESGATIAELARMTRRNLSVEFGDAFDEAMAEWEHRWPDLERRVVRVRTDNRLLPHEWLRTPDGRLIKTDALDHHQSHDLAGCQDVAWDVAGAAVEFAFDEAEEKRVTEAVEEWGYRSVDRDLLDFYRIAYLAFRLGQMRLGGSMTGDLAERQRIAAAGDAYARQIALLLQGRRTGTRHQSPVV